MSFPWPDLTEEEWLEADQQLRTAEWDESKHPRDEKGQWTDSGGTTTIYHGTISGSIQSIRARGLLRKFAGRYYPGLAKSGSIYLSSDPESAAKYAIEAALRYNMEGRPGTRDVTPVVFKVVIPSSYASKIIRDMEDNVGKPHTGYQFNDDIRPEWIKEISKVKENPYTYERTSRPNLDKFKALGGRVIYVPWLIIDDEKNRDAEWDDFKHPRALGGAGSGWYAENPENPHVPGAKAKTGQEFVQSSTIYRGGIQQHASASFTGFVYVTNHRPTAEQYGEVHTYQLTKTPRLFNLDEPTPRAKQFIADILGDPTPDMTDEDYWDGISSVYIQGDPKAIPWLRERHYDGMKVGNEAALIGTLPEYAKEIRHLGGAGSGWYAENPENPHVPGAKSRDHGDQEIHLQETLAAQQKNPLAHPSLLMGNDNAVGGEVERFVAAYGKEFKAAPLPNDIKHGPKGQCFMNASQLVLHHPELTYAEGFAEDGEIPGFTFVHAWAVTKDGTVVDPTWDHPEKNRYFGVQYDREKYLAHLWKAKFYGVIGSSFKKAQKAIKTGAKDLR